MRSTAQRLGSLIVRNRRPVIIACCVIVFVLLLEDVLEGELMRIDQLAYLVLVDALRGDELTPIMEGLSALASPVVLSPT